MGYSEKNERVTEEVVNILTKEQNIMFAPLHHIRNYSRNEQVRQWDVILCGYLYGKEEKNVVILH